MRLNKRERRTLEQRSDRGTHLGAEAVLLGAIEDNSTDELAAPRAGRTRLRMLTAAAILAAVCTVGAAVWLADSRQESDTTIASTDCVPSRTVVVYVDPGATPQAIVALETALNEDPAVANVRYVDQADTYEEFQRLFEGQAEMLENVRAGDLPTSFQVEVANGEDPDEVAGPWMTVESVFEVSVAPNAGPRCGSTQDEAGVVSVDPAGSLVPGDSIEVTGSGFAPSAALSVALCLPEAVVESDPALCDLGTASSAIADANGALRTSLVAKNPMRVATWFVQCGPTQKCVVAVSPVGRYDEAVATPVSFAPVNDSLPSSSLTAIRDASEHDRTRVEVSGAGFAPRRDIRVFLCVAGESGQPNLAHCDLDRGQTTGTDQLGGFTLELQVGQIQAGNSADDPIYDCRADTPECLIVGETVGDDGSPTYTPIE